MGNGMDGSGGKRVNRKFDLKRAKAGEPVEFLYPGVAHEYWVPCHFIGIDKSGLPVVQTEPHHFYMNPEVTSLRMAPKEARYRLSLMSSEKEWDLYVAVANSKNTADRLEQSENFVEWMGDWRTAKVSK